MKVQFTVNATRNPGTSTSSNGRDSTVSTHVESSSLTTFTGSTGNKITDFNMTFTSLMTTTASTTKLNTADILSQTLTSTNTTTFPGESEASLDNDVTNTSSTIPANSSTTT